MQRVGLVTALTAFIPIVGAFMGGFCRGAVLISWVQLTLLGIIIL